MLVLYCFFMLSDFENNEKCFLARYLKFTLPHMAGAKQGGERNAQHKQAKFNPVSHTVGMFVAAENA